MHAGRVEAPLGSFSAKSDPQARRWVLGEHLIDKPVEESRYRGASTDVPCRSKVNMTFDRFALSRCSLQKLSEHRLATTFLSPMPLLRSITTSEPASAAALTTLRLLISRQRLPHWAPRLPPG